MAMIKEYKSSGTLIRIFDDYIPKTKEENSIRYSLLNEVAKRIVEKEMCTNEN